MEGKTLIRNVAYSYVAFILSSIWRKKSTLLLILGALLILAFCIQYNITKDIIEMRIQQPPEVIVSQKNFRSNSNTVLGSPNEIPNKKSNVQFINGGGSNSESLTAKSMLDIIGNNPVKINSPYNVEVQHADVDRLQIAMHLNNPAISDNIDLVAAVAVDDNRFTTNQKMPYIPGHRIVHLDLKGAPPKPSYIKEFFKLIEKLGATGVLLEWEDMFPWTDNLSELAAHNAYSIEDVLEIISSAKSLGLEIIPLVQTFGHLEFALKIQEFSHLREVPESPQALCPSLNASLEFVQDMIDQVMKVHRGINFLHIGCDEVFNIGECPRCRKKLRDDLFLSHVAEVASYVRRKYPFVTPIIWDDMLRHLPLSTMQAYHIGQLVEPMIWVYAEDVYRFVPPSVWEKYNALFAYAWTASAFKGAFGETFYIPNVKRHFDNNMNWLQLMSVENSKFKKGFRGISITGWQRYDHFAVLCELLPAAIPSLCVNLVALSNGNLNDTLFEHLYKELHCPNGSPSMMTSSNHDSNFFNHDPFLFDHFSRCSFTGSHFYRLVHRLQAVERDIKEFLKSTKKVKGWLTDYNIRKNFTSPLRVDELMFDESRLYHSLISLIPSAQSALENFFDKYTISEWVEQRIYPLVFELENLEKAANSMKMVKIWPRRPFPPLNDLQRFGLTFPDNNLTTSD